MSDLIYSYNLHVHGIPCPECNISSTIQDWHKRTSKTSGTLTVQLDANIGKHPNAWFICPSCDKRIIISKVPHFVSILGG